MESVYAPPYPPPVPPLYEVEYYPPTVFPLSPNDSYDLQPHSASSRNRGAPKLLTLKLDCRFGDRI